MLYIPISLMITPLSAYNDPVMGNIFRDAGDVLRGITYTNLVILIRGLLAHYVSFIWAIKRREFVLVSLSSHTTSPRINIVLVIWWFERATGDSKCCSAHFIRQDTRIAHRAMNKRATLEVRYGVFLSKVIRLPISPSCNPYSNVFL